MKSMVHHLIAAACLLLPAAVQAQIATGPAIGTSNADITAPLDIEAITPPMRSQAAVNANLLTNETEILTPRGIIDEPAPITLTRELDLDHLRLENLLGQPASELSAEPAPVPQ